jgi:hypothetical protein
MALEAHLRQRLLHPHYVLNALLCLPLPLLALLKICRERSFGNIDIRIGLPLVLLPGLVFRISSWYTPGQTRAYATRASYTGCS